MRRCLVVSLLFLACPVSPPRTDGGSGGGAAGSEGGGGGGTGGGCISAPGCSCGAGGGAVLFSDRLVVASRGERDAGEASVRVWNAVSTIVQDGPGAAQPFLTGVPIALAGGFGQLTSHSVIAVKEDGAPVQEWTGNLTPACDLPSELAAASLGAGRAEQVSNRLWFVRSPGEVVRLSEPAGSAAPTAVFTNPGQPLREFAVDPDNDRLFAAHAGGIVVWSGASTVAGDAGSADFQLSTDEASDLEVRSGRLYGSARGSQLEVWEIPAALSAPAAVAFTLDAGQGVSIRHHTVVSGQLFVTVQPTPTTGRVLIYKNIAAATGDRAPDIVIEHPSLAGAQKSAFAGDRLGLRDAGTLLVLTSQGVAIFGDPLGAPAFKTTLTSGISAPADMLYLP